MHARPCRRCATVDGKQQVRTHVCPSNDKNDARGLAQILRTGWFRAVHIKSDESYRMRLLLIGRRNMKRKFLDIENAIRHSLKAFGIRLGQVSRGRFEAKVRDMLADDPVLIGMVEGMLRVRAVLWVEYCELHRLLVKIVARDAICRRFLSVPGVGLVTALSFRASVDDPHRFAKSRTVGAHFGLTPRRWQSGTSIDRGGRISRMGDGDVRTALYEAANALLTKTRRPVPLKKWGEKIARKRGHKAACVAVARKLAVIMHAMWRDGTDFGAPKIRCKPHPDPSPAGRLPRATGAGSRAEERADKDIGSASGGRLSDGRTIEAGSAISCL